MFERRTGIVTGYFKSTLGTVAWISRSMPGTLYNSEKGLLVLLIQHQHLVVGDLLNGVKLLDILDQISCSLSVDGARRQRDGVLSLSRCRRSSPRR
jgi:hypothetical protein